ncbi:MAG: universal stress protein [Sphingomonadales bacterium]
MASAAQQKDVRPVRPIVQRKRKFLVVVDHSPESRVAIRFASGRAAHVEGGVLVLIHVIPPAEFQHWMAVEDHLREESYAKAEKLLSGIADEVYDYTGTMPVIAMLEGQPKEALEKFLDEEEDLFALFLASSTDGDPGPLVNYFSGPLSGTLHCPVVIVPGCLSDEEIDDMT